ncbi:MAG: Y-family DNA polymerase [Cyanobacteria bacterium P01_E01_bin.45]
MCANSSHQQVALADCNNFYASCERVFNPKWIDRPIAILSNNDGCIVARSNEIKELGVPMGAPYFKWKAFLERNNAIVVSSNYTLYGDMSARVMNTLGQFTPNLDIYSIDEAWLDLTNFKPDTLVTYGRDIARTVKQWTGIPVSIGIAPTRVLAKVANRIAKKRKVPGGVYRLENNEELNEILENLEVEDIWGIGRRWGKRLRMMGIGTARDLRDTDPDMMRRKFSVVMQRLVLELQGVSCIGPEDIAPKQQIMCSRSFGERVTTLTHLKQAVSMHVGNAARKLRSQQSVCGLAQVFIRTGLFNPNEPTYSQSAMVKFPTPTADTRAIAKGAMTALEGIYRKRFRYAKAGVILMDISPSALVQRDLFFDADSERSQLLMETLDGINRRMGRRSVFFAGEGSKRVWLMKRRMTTNAYTTQWGELMIVR